MAFLRGAFFDLGSWTRRPRGPSRQLHARCWRWESVTPLVGGHKRLFHVGSSQTHRKVIFPSKKINPPMRKSRQTEQPHMNFRRLAASDEMTRAFLPRVSQIKQGNMQLSVQTLTAGRYREGNPPKRHPFRPPIHFSRVQVRKGRHGYRRPTSVEFKFGLGAKMSPA